MAQITLNPSKDVHMTSSDATVNQNGIGFIDVGEAVAATSTRRLLIQFDLTSIPSGSTVNTATLRLYDQGTDLGDNARTMSAYRCRRVWGETTATWNTTDGSTAWTSAGANDTTNDREATVIGSIVMPTPAVAGYVDITLTASLIKEWLDGVFTNNGLVLRMATETDDLHRFDSRDEANKPQLVVDYIPPGGSYSFFM